VNLLFHQFRKDCLRLRVPIALWLVLVLLRVALITPGVAEPGVDAATQTLYRVFTILVPLLQNLLVLVIVPLLIHEEPLVGTTAFWFTRPIDGLLLFRSKLFFILVVLLSPPLFAEIGVLAVHGATPTQLALAVPEILLEDMKFLSFVVILAALTLTFARYALLGSSLYIGYLLVGIAASIFELYRELPDFLLWARSASLGDSRYVVGGIALILFATAILAYQYRTRDVRRTWVGVGGAVIAVLAVSQFWPWDFMPQRHRPGQAEIDTAGVTVMLSTDPRSRRISDAYLYRSKQEPKKTISGRLEVSGLPPGHVAEATEVDASLRFPDGTVITWDGHEPEGFERKWEPNAVQRAIGGARILDPEKRNLNTVTLLTVKDDLFSKYAATRGAYEAEVKFSLKRYDAVGRFRAKSKARYDRGTEHTVVTQVLKQTGAATVVLRESEVSLFFAGDRHSYDLGFNPFRQRTLYIMQNERLREALWPKKDIGPDFEVVDFFQKRLRTVPLALRYSASTDSGGTLTELSDAWLDGAEIVRIEAVEVGHFRKKISVSDFTMRAQ
jgi:hypothetical protein